MDAIYVKLFCSTFVKLLSMTALIARKDLELDWKVRIIQDIKNDLK
jgi:hypothetical protein